MGRNLVVWSVKDIRECIEKMTSPEKKFDFVCFIDGRRGNGKSTLAYKIFSGLKVEKRFSPYRDIVYSREDTIKHFTRKINGCIFSDEMVNVAYKRDFYENDQKELLKAFDMYRDSRNVFIGCIPEFSDLDVKIQKVAKMRITVVRRGIGIIQTQMASMYTSDKWDIKNNQKIESKWVNKGLKNPRYAQLSTVKGIVKFSDLTPSQRVEYDRIKFEKRNHTFAKYRDAELETDPERIFIKNLAGQLKEGLVTPEVFKLMCKANGKEEAKIKLRVNKFLKQGGSEQTFKDLCLTKERRQKKDILNFKKNDPQIILKVPTQANDATIDKEYDDSDEKSDIFGFN